MKEYILNIKFENWQKQLWFMNEDTIEANEKWNDALKEIDTLRNESNEPIEFQNKVIEYFKKLGFIRIQK